ncbi:single-stranded DNA-binding protein, partial [Candidatus Bipolaricaulota bacterium]|nr:single-stranded DNA-binding protein [Candidatus Bipolaricaulota bacterium]
RQVYIEGRIQTRSWEDKEGVKRYTTEIVASKVDFIGGGNGGGGDRPPPPGDSDTPPQDMDADIPF